MTDSEIQIEAITAVFCGGMSEEARLYCKSQLENLVRLAQVEKEIEMLNKSIEETKWVSVGEPA